MRIALFKKWLRGKTPAPVFLGLLRVDERDLERGRRDRDWPRPMLYRGLEAAQDLTGLRGLNKSKNEEKNPLPEENEPPIYL